MRLILTAIILTMLAQPVWSRNTIENASVNRNLCEIIEQRLPKIKAAWAEMQTEYDEKYNAYKRELSGVALYDWEKLTDARRRAIIAS